MRTMNDHLRDIIEQVEAILQSGDPRAALELCDLAVKEFPTEAEPLFFRALSLQIDGQLEDAMDAFYQAALADKNHYAAWCHLGLLSIELLEFTQAQHAIVRAIRSNPTCADGWWIRSLLRELLGDDEGARRARALASWFDPVHYPKLPKVTDDEIHRIYHEAISEMSESEFSLLSQMPVILEECPSATILNQYAIAPSPIRLLGHVMLSPKTETQPQGPMVILFRQNLRRAWDHSEELLDSLRCCLAERLDVLFNDNPAVA